MCSLIGKTHIQNWVKYSLWGIYDKQLKYGGWEGDGGGEVSSVGNEEGKTGRFQDWCGMAGWEPILTSLCFHLYVTAFTDEKKRKKKAENSKRVNKHVLQNPAESPEASTLEAKAASSNTRGDFRIKSPLCLMLGNMHDLHAHSKPPHLSKNNKKMCLFFFPLHGPVKEFTFTHYNRWF